MTRIHYIRERKQNMLIWSLNIKVQWKDTCPHTVEAQLVPCLCRDDQSPTTSKSKASSVQSSRWFFFEGQVRSRLLINRQAVCRSVRFSFSLQRNTKAELPPLTIATNDPRQTPGNFATCRRSWHPNAGSLWALWDLATHQEFFMTFHDIVTLCTRCPTNETAGMFEVFDYAQPWMLQHPGVFEPHGPR